MLRQLFRIAIIFSMTVLADGVGGCSDAGCVQGVYEGHMPAVATPEQTDHLSQLTVRFEEEKGKGPRDESKGCICSGLMLGGNSIGLVLTSTTCAERLGRKKQGVSAVTPVGTTYHVIGFVSALSEGRTHDEKLRSIYNDQSNMVLVAVKEATKPEVSLPDEHSSVAAGKRGIFLATWHKTGGTWKISEDSLLLSTRTAKTKHDINVLLDPSMDEYWNGPYLSVPIDEPNECSVGGPMYTKNGDAPGITVLGVKIAFHSYVNVRNHAERIAMKIEKVKVEGGRVVIPLGPNEGPNNGNKANVGGQGSKAQSARGGKGHVGHSGFMAQ